MKSSSGAEISGGFKQSCFLDDPGDPGTPGPPGYDPRPKEEKDQLEFAEQLFDSGMWDADLKLRKCIHGCWVRYREGVVYHGNRGHECLNETRKLDEELSQRYVTKRLDLPSIDLSGKKIHVHTIVLDSKNDGDDGDAYDGYHTDDWRA